MSAADGEQAVELLHQRSFDLLVSELMLSKRHGHAVVVEAQQLASPPRIAVLTQLSDPRLVRDLLSRGIDDYLHKSAPLELIATKLEAIFMRDAWQSARAQSQQAPEVAPVAMSLEEVEAKLRCLSDYFRDRLEGLFNLEYAPPEMPAGVVHYLDSLTEQATATQVSGIVDAASTRASQRVAYQAEAMAVQVDARYRPIDLAARVMIRDVSTTGVRLLHTRAIPATDLVVAWQAETIPQYVFRIPLCITRCRPSGRFYDIGGEFDIPDEVAQRLEHEALATS